MPMILQTVRVGMGEPPSTAVYTLCQLMSMNTEWTRATAFITKEIHMALAQPALFFMVVPQAIMVGSVTHWKPA